MTPFPHSIEATENLTAAREMMQHHDIGHLPVTKDGKLIGVLLQHQLRPSHREDDELPQEDLVQVGDVCVPSPYVTKVSDQLDNVVMEMARRGASCALVLRNDKLAGILTAGDVCRLFGELLRASFTKPESDEPA